MNLTSVLTIYAPTIRRLRPAHLRHLPTRLGPAPGTFVRLLGSGGEMIQTCQAFRSHPASLHCDATRHILLANENMEEKLYPVAVPTPRHRLAACFLARSDKAPVADPPTVPCASLVARAGYPGGRSLRGVSITKDHDFGPVNVVYHWAEGEEEPWRLVTNLPPRFRVVRLYKRRVWIEELFGDWQEGTFHPHQTRLCDPEKLSRLLLGLSLVYVWLVSVTSYVVKRGWRPLIDRTDRRDRCYLTLGLQWVKRRLRNREPPRMRLQPYF